MDAILRGIAGLLLSIPGGSGNTILDATVFGGALLRIWVADSDVNEETGCIGPPGMNVHNTVFKM